MKNNQFNKNLLICGDNLKALDDLKKQRIKADLIYLDPPFFSNRHYEVVWGDEAEVRSFKDRWAGGIHVYIEWMKERIKKMAEVLKDSGSFYLHCDPHASHHLKIMLDNVLGHQNFRSEIHWQRTSSHSDSKKWPNIHDTIFYYARERATWNPQYLAHSPEYVSKFYRYKDDRGVYRHDHIIRSASMGPRPNLAYEYKGYTPKWGWRMLRDKVEVLDNDNRIAWSKTGRPYLKRYLPEQKGTMVSSLWTDIPPVSPHATERLGYPTQKPEALLERIIKASTNKNDLILDPFCGCGTAMAVAHKLNRKWIGIDISPTAISLIEKRLDKLGAIKRKDFDSIGMPTTITELKALEPFEFQNWVINEMRAKQSKKLVADMGLNGYYDKTIFTEEAGIQVKQSEKVGRNVVDNFETALRRGKYKMGFIVAFSFTKGTHEETARVKGKGLDIKLIRVEDLLLGKIKI
ncbi:MAG TPA: site-specific DNA-methyltransferase [Candidatus Aminicenantes bacterium]|nr:site-specific DNA-methyltransferase [Candidatus Aminicenantes bacterium]